MYTVKNLENLPFEAQLELLGIKTSGRLDNDIKAECWRKRKDINEMLDAIRLKNIQGMLLWDLYRTSMRATKDVPPNYYSQVIKELKNAPSYAEKDLLYILGIDNNEEAIFENRKLLVFIMDKLIDDMDIDQVKKNAFQSLKDSVNCRANKYKYKGYREHDLTKAYEIRNLQKDINEYAEEYAHANDLPLDASPATAIDNKDDLITRLKIASCTDLVGSYYSCLELLDIKTISVENNIIEAECYKKRQDINQILDAVRLSGPYNPKVLP